MQRFIDYMPCYGFVMDDSFSSYNSYEPTFLMLLYKPKFKRLYFIFQFKHIITIGDKPLLMWFRYLVEGY